MEWRKETMRAIWTAWRERAARARVRLLAWSARVPRWGWRATWAAWRERAARARVRLLAWSARVPRWGWIVLAAVGALLVVRLGYEFPWMGFAAATAPKSDTLEYRPAKTLWDWLGLLVIPLLLAVGGYWFTHRREELARSRESERSREEVLQGYLDRMTVLMLDKSLRDSRDDDPVRDVARSLTLLVLRRLDGERRGHLLRFVHESELITKGRTILRLEGADLRGADLTVADLGRADLRGADLDVADLSRALIGGADLRGADLSRALIGGANLSRALIGGADLSGANLSGADLRWAMLHGADLRLAVLRLAVLRGADLREAQNLTQDQLDSALGDARTQLPEGLVRPPSWGDAATS